MSRKVITISLPENTTKWVRDRVSSGEFISLSDYFRQLVRDDQARRRVLAANQRTLDELYASPAKLR